MQRSTSEPVEIGIGIGSVVEDVADCSDFDSDSDTDFDEDGWSV
jgi:hypothetical protein